MNPSHHHFFICLSALSLLLSACAGTTTLEHTDKIASPETQRAAASEVLAISFKEFYKLPIGPRGLEPSPKLLDLNNKRVRITGYLVKEEEPTPGLFMLAPLPVALAEKEDGPADDLPATTLFVHMPDEDAGKAVSFRPGLWELTGTLQVGNQQEANGRVSHTRLILN